VLLPIINVEEPEFLISPHFFHTFAETTETATLDIFLEHGPRREFIRRRIRANKSTHSTRPPDGSELGLANN
jgi:hypothetical protein